MENVFILNGVDGTFEIAEAFDTKYGFSHSEGVLIDGFTSKEDAESYCYEFDLCIIN